MDSLLAPEGGESQPDIITSQLPVRFSQFGFGGSGPASPDNLPSIAEIWEEMKATQINCLDGEHTIAEDNPKSSLKLGSDNPDGGESGSDNPPIPIEDSDGSDNDDTMPATALSEPSQPSKAYSTIPETTASSPSITTAKTSPPQSHPNDSGCPTGSAEIIGLVKDDEDRHDNEDLSDIDSGFARHHHTIAKRRDTPFNGRRGSIAITPATVTHAISIEIMVKPREMRNDINHCLRKPTWLRQVISTLSASMGSGGYPRGAKTLLPALWLAHIVHYHIVAAGQFLAYGICLGRIELLLSLIALVIHRYPHLPLFQPCQK
ncbi:hypothetical protein MKZ38_002685 [Zalerion maritima]|uniref:Uncharacterized protein n=1 Tax=Zalerion maritima TaxID=339359 RepID=A0AAD5RQ64_9PEZI|nr:hypothetical protein MKZ38_002685 [Zalerion maritima]